jgi:phosphatidylglycerophosphatase A
MVEGARVGRGIAQRVAAWVATVGGVGRCPVASGTFGSLPGLALLWVLPADPVVQGAVLAAVMLAGWWAAGVVAAMERDTDPGIVVIDEVAGMLVAGFLLPRHPGPLLAAFLLFRVFDIGKWPPMRQLERLPGGWGIIADDVAAGLLARLVMFAWLR